MAEDAQDRESAVRELLEAKPKQVPAIRFRLGAIADALSTRFEYRMVGVDDSWVPADSRRVAYYTWLPPRRLTFALPRQRRSGLRRTG